VAKRLESATVYLTIKRNDDGTYAYGIAGAEGVVVDRALGGKLGEANVAFGVTGLAFVRTRTLEQLLDIVKTAAESQM